MPHYDFVLESTDVTLTTAPTFDHPGRSSHLVSGQDLDGAIEALDGETLSFDCYPNEVTTRLRTEAEALLAGANPALSFGKVLTNPSVPTTGGSGWSGSGGVPVLHPSENGANVCVVRTGTPGSYSWRQVAFKAIES